MLILRKLRVYQELFAVLGAVLLVLVLSHHRGNLAPAYATEDRGADEVLSDAALSEEVTATPEGVVEAPAALGASKDGPAAIATPAPTPADKERILVIGDSMVEVLAPTLNAYAIENGDTFVPAIWYGSTTAAWARTPELGKLLREIDPTLVIVVLGSSELTSRSIETRRPFIRTIEKRIGQRKLVWIGPPNWRPDSGINDLLESELGKDRFFRSEHLELTRKKDGIHPDAAGGRVWMTEIAGWLGNDSRFSLALKPPSHTAAAPPARVLGVM